MGPIIRAKPNILASHSSQQVPAAVAQQRCRCRAAPRSMAGTHREPRVRHLPSVLELTDRYKGMLLDQFGCLHDGQQPYPGAVEAVAALAEGGMQILLLSNSSRRASGALEKLAKMGFDSKDFVGVVTSGEVTHQHLLERPTPSWQQLGHRCLHFTWGSRGAVSLEGLGLQVVSDPGQADFVLAHGTEVLGQGDGSEPVAVSIADMEALLQQCAAVTGRQVPMIVANPDLVTVDGAQLRVMPGSLAKFYQSIGGEVHLMGKPSPVIYEAASRLVNLAPCDLVAVGDSLEHDIGGAATAGIDSLFIRGGIHADHFVNLAAEPLGELDAAVHQLCEQHRAWPTFTMQSFTS